MEQVLTQTQRKWAERIARWEESGLGREEFAAKEGIVGERLSWWRWKLKSLGISPLEVVGEAKASGPSFVRLELPDSTQRTERAEPLELMLSDGRRLRIPAGFDAQTLSRVLSLLARGES